MDLVLNNLQWLIYRKTKPKQAYIKFLRGGSALLDWEGGCWNTLRLAAREPSVGSQKYFCNYITPKIWSLKSPEYYNPVYRVWDAVEREIKKILSNAKKWTEGKDNCSIF